ncbi:MAG: hypothetical protein Q4D02_01920 [Clostridia bacterium]|nr:hypothetical protein [Clostridia bacterium]
MNIQVGEYVRTFDGIIGKILEEDDIGNLGVIIDNSFLDDCADITNFVRYKNIKKHSFNIIDLIEEDDVLKYRLNNLSCINIDKVKVGKEARIFKEYLNVNRFSLEQIEILSIVTKEQFKSVEYEV